MKNINILDVIHKMEKLTPEQLNMICSAIDSCMVVQSIKIASKNPEALSKLAKNIS